MTPYFTPRQGKSLNRRRHTVLRRNILYASPWVVSASIMLGLLLWVISLFLK